MDVHETAIPLELDIVHAIVPAGAGFPDGPATNAVNVVVPPSVGVPIAAIEIVGARLETPKVTEFEVPAR